MDALAGQYRHAAGHPGGGGGRHGRADGRFHALGRAHLVANGDLAHAILFGLLLAYALFGLAISLRRGGGWHLRWPRLLAALAVWAGLLHLHLPVIGVSPLP